MVNIGTAATHAIQQMAYGCHGERPGIDCHPTALQFPNSRRRWRSYGTTERRPNNVRNVNVAMVLQSRKKEAQQCHRNNALIL